MKIYSKSLLLPFLVLLAVATGLGSCKKYLNKSPLADINEQEAFKNFRNFQGFTEELYGCIPVLTAVGSHNNWNFGEDEMWEPTENRMLSYYIDNGDFFGWNSSSVIFGSYFRNGGNPSSQGNGDKGALWGLAWYAIRKANIGIANLDLMVDATEEEKNLIAGQLYFFRGWFHLMLMQTWGGLPYVDHVLPTDETPKLPRLNYQATADKVTADLQKASELLPVNWDLTTVGRQTEVSEGNRYRPNKVMALSFLGKNLLLAGSPLMNRESTGSSTYNTEYCKKAADVFGQVLKMCEESGQYKLAHFDNYPQVFYTRNQREALPGTIRSGDSKINEAILLEGLAGAGGRFRWNQITDYRPPTIVMNGIKVYPTANYVDLYGMANGMPIKDPEKADPVSGYDPEYPWRNRDPRFYHDIVIDGEKMVNDIARVGNDEQRQYASLFTGGKYRTLNPNKAVFTGYMLTKFFPRMLNDWDGNLDGNTVVLSLLRLPDVYLMYAEAASEAYNSPMGKAPGYNKTAVDAVNFVRNRPGLGVGPVAAEFLVSQDAFRTEYRRERAVELAFEGHRFLDLRRWLQLIDRPYTYKKGIEFDRATPNAQIYANPRAARVRNFRETILFERKFTERHYWFPFIISDANLYADFKQNPGW